MKVFVIGGGAAGMMAAIGAAEYGHEVTIFERNEKLGKKIYITGKGRCNVTNNCSSDELMKHVIRNPRFLYSAFSTFDNSDIQNMLEEMGCELKVERGDRVFPVSDHSSDVIKALRKKLDYYNIQVEYRTKIAKILTNDNSVCGIETATGEDIYCDWVIIATGGASYQTTGSDGSAFSMLQYVGHTVEELKPALVPLETDEEWVHRLQGLSLKNVRLTMLLNDKKIYSEQGEMLFTHKGISGPLVLTASSYYEPGCNIEIDLKPALDDSKLDERLLRDFGENINRDFNNSLNDLLPKKIIPEIITKSGIPSDKKVHQITSEERAKLKDTIKHLKINISKTAGFDEAIITRGGIRIKEVDPSTMQSKIINGLSLAGEMLDLDAVTGGFNLQIAWSTGYLAGTRAGW